MRNTVEIISSRHPAQESAVATADIDLLNPWSIDRPDLEQFIADRYRQVYDARLNHFLPLLMRVQMHGRTLAALGLRPGCCGPMYLENYLGGPIEQAIAKHARAPVQRASIVEVGNLVSACPGSSQSLFLVMAAAVHKAGYRWMAFTATRQVRKLLKRLNYHPILLERADATCLGEDASRWGRYYETQPQVLAGGICAAMENMLGNAAMRSVLDRYQRRIGFLADRLKHQRHCYGNASEC